MSLGISNTAFFGLYFGQPVESISGSFLLNLVTLGNLLMLLVDLKIIFCTIGFEDPEDFPSLPGASEDVECGPPLDVRLLEMEEVDAELLQRGCAICLGDFLPGEELGSLPCEHHFHRGCISEWLLRSRACPLRCASDESQAWPNQAQLEAILPGQVVTVSH